MPLLATKEYNPMLLTEAKQRRILILNLLFNFYSSISIDVLKKKPFLPNAGKRGLSLLVTGRILTTS